jgi:hypothetical protein
MDPAILNRFIDAADDLLGLQQAELMRLGLSVENRRLTETYLQARSALLHAMPATVNPKRVGRKPRQKRKY